MERIVHKTTDFRNAEQWDILQQVQSSIDERLRAAKEIQHRYYGSDCPDVREIRDAVIRHER